MKKLVALVLSLCILFSLSSVLADDNSHSVEASYTVEDPSVDGVEAYSLTISWNVGKAAITQIGAVYKWSAEELKYVEKTAAYQTGSADISVTITNSGNKAATCTLNFVPKTGVTSTFTPQTNTIASAAAAFDPSNPDAAGSVKSLTLTGKVNITGVTEDVMNEEGASASSFTIGTATLSFSDVND